MGINIFHIYQKNSSLKYELNTNDGLEDFNVIREL